MLKRGGSSFNRRHTMTSFIDKTTVNNHNCVDVESPNGNGHCVIDRKDNAERYNVNKIQYFSEDQEMLDKNDQDSRHEMYPMTKLTDRSEGKEDASYPMLNNKHSDDDNTWWITDDVQSN